MANDQLNNTAMSAEGIHTHEEILRLAEEYYNVQKKIETSDVRHANSLLKMFGTQKSLVSSMGEMIDKSGELNKSIENSKNQETELLRKISTEGLPSKRREMEYHLRSIKQRRAAQESELEFNKVLLNSAVLPLILAYNEVMRVFRSMDDAAAKFRVTVGMIRDISQRIRKIASDTAVEFMHLGVTIDSAYASVIALGDAMGSMHIVTKDLVATTSILKAQLGIAEEDSSKFFQNMAGVSKSTMQSQKDMSYLAGYMSNVAGIPLPIVMKEIASASGNTLTMMSRIPFQVVKSVIELKKMGTSLKQAADSGRQILNFQESVNAEMEASVLLGRSINLQHARELAYRRDTVGFTKEILNISRKIDFENLDVFQQEAFANAIGKSVEELTSMLVAKREWDAARNSSDPEIQKMVEAYDQMESASKNTLMSESERFKKTVQEKSNQATLVEIQQKWSQILTKIGYTLLPIVDKILGFVANNFDVIVYSASSLMFIMRSTLPIIGGMITTLSFIGRIFGVMGGSVSFVIDKLVKMSTFILTFSDRIRTVSTSATTLTSPFNKMLLVMSKIQGFFGSIGTKISVFLGVFGRFGPMLFGPMLLGLKGLLPPLGFVITVFQAIYGIIKGWKSGHGFWDSLFKGLLGGLRAIVKPIFELLILPFNLAGANISLDWMGQSPSKIGLGIVKGLSSVGDMMESALTTPFDNAAVGMKDISKNFHNEISDMIKTPLKVPIETNISSVYNPGTRIKSSEMVASSISDKPSPAKDSKSEKDDTNSSDVCLKNILDAINNLNTNLMNGKIGFYLDGQLLSATLARQTEFRRGFGTNHIS